MTALLKDAFRPNLVQTLEHTPALVHGGPFANIAHGCNSLLATQTALGLADFVVTEAGFGADLGAEKFLDIKCRTAGLEPAAAVIVATIRACKMHGGVDKRDLSQEDVRAVEIGASNLARHVDNLQRFGLPVVVALNGFTSDTQAEIAALRRICRGLGVACHVCTHWADGGAGAEELARDVARLATSGEASFRPLYDLALPLEDKIRIIARQIYRADDIALSPAATKTLNDLQEAGYGSLPVCMAKTQYSFTTDPEAKGAPSGFTLPVRDIRLSAGAGFVVALCGEILTMPGLPRRPAALDMSVDARGDIHGLD
jgi:formate--tetrahydrofolate ligase